MNILVLLIANGEYLKGANIVIDTFKQYMTNPEGHNITFRIDAPNTDFDYLQCYNTHLAGTRISLGRFKYFNLSEFDRIIYMDSDMEVIGNIDLLISSELNSKPFWAVHCNNFDVYYGDRMKSQDITNDMVINGGLQIINKPLLSKEFYDKFVNSLVKGESFDGSDQGYISKIFPKLGVDIGWLPEKYNYCFQDGYCTKDLEDVRIRHYTGVKLWKVRHV